MGAEFRNQIYTIMLVETQWQKNKETTFLNTEVESFFIKVTKNYADLCVLPFVLFYLEGIKFAISNKCCFQFNKSSQDVRVWDS